MKTKNILNSTLTVCIIILITGISQAQITSPDGNYYFKNANQRLYGDNNAYLFHYSNHSTISSFLLFDKEGQKYGYLFGGGDGEQFGLRDGNNKWSYLAVKDSYTSFSIGGSEKMRILANGNVGIGTTSPATNFEVDGRATFNTSLTVGPYNSGYRGIVVDNNANYGWDLLNLKNINGVMMTVKGNGKVGIGNVSPQAHVHIGQRLTMNSATSGGSGWIGNNIYWDGTLKRVAAGATADVSFSSNGDMIFRTSAPQGGANSDITNIRHNMKLHNGGGVTVGAGNGGNDALPNGYQLAVYGKTITEEVKVKPSQHWPDYVFTPEYKRLSIEELKKYIETEGHLPNMPKAEVVEAEGYHLGEMDIKLLEKIEELTLYTIEADKTTKQQQKQIDELTQLVNELKAQINK